MITIHLNFFAMQKTRFIRMAFIALCMTLVVTTFSGCNLFGGAPKKPVVIENQNITYIPYSQEAFNNMNGKGKMVLFFHADWCPSCRALETEIVENQSQLTGAYILKVDYDNADDLKKKYGITSQHTLVFINADGSVQEVKKGAKLADVASFFETVNTQEEENEAVDADADSDVEDGQVEENQDAGAAQDEENTEETQENETEEVEQNEPEPTAQKQDTPVNGELSYVNYNEAVLASAKGQGKVAVFFHAEWCPKCRALEAALMEQKADLGGVKIIKVDYDTETDLKVEYGVLLQDTVVFLNADGSVEKTVVSPKVDEIKTFFNQA